MRQTATLWMVAWLGVVSLLCSASLQAQEAPKRGLFR